MKKITLILLTVLSFSKTHAQEPLVIQKNYFLSQLDINYRAECYVNEAISIETHQKVKENDSDTEGSNFQQRIVRKSDGKDLVWANVKYRRF